LHSIASLIRYGRTDGTMGLLEFKRMLASLDETHGWEHSILAGASRQLPLIASDCLRLPLNATLDCL
jgi:hypothetical protein